MFFDLPPEPPKIWLPPKPAIIRPGADLVVPKPQALMKARRRGAALGYDPYFSYVHLLLHGGGADASTTFTDSSQFARAMGLGNQAQIDTAQSKFGGSSILFDGNADYIYVVNPSIYSIYTGDFTVEMFVRLNGLGTNQCLFDFRAANDDKPLLQIDTANKLLWYSSPSIRIQGTTAMTTGVWYHVAVSRVSGSTRMFLDGVQEGATFTDAISYTAGNNRPIMGTAYTGSAFYFNGWMDEIRITVGIGRYSANFAPPTEAFPDVGLGLADCVLTHQAIAVDSTSLTTYTFASMAFGTASADRYVIACIVGRSGLVRTLDSVTIGGIAATEVRNWAPNDSGNTSIVSTWIAPVPSGTSGNVVATFNGAMARAACATYSVTNLESMVERYGWQDLNNVYDAILSIPKGGFAIAVHIGDDPSVGHVGTTQNGVTTLIGNGQYIDVGSIAVGSTPQPALVAEVNANTDTTMGTVNWTVLR